MLCFVVFGIIMGPILARWNHFLEHQFPLRPSSALPAAQKLLGGGTAHNVHNAVAFTPSGENVSLTALAKRVGMDQAIMAPLGVRFPAFGLFPHY